MESGEGSRIGQEEKLRCNVLPERPQSTCIELWSGKKLLRTGVKRWGHASHVQAALGRWHGWTRCFLQLEPPPNRAAC